MLIILFLNARVYLINHYFLTAPGKFLTAQVEFKNRWGGIYLEFTRGGKKIFVRFAREKSHRPR